jgi:hypothetical protein
MQSTADLLTSNITRMENEIQPFNLLADGLFVAKINGWESVHQWASETCFVPK